MADIHVKVDDVAEVAAVSDFVLTPELVKKYFNVAKSSTKLLKNLAKLSPTTFDDNLIGWVEEVLVVLEPYVEEKWVYDLVNSIIDLFKKKGIEEVAKYVKEIAPLLVK